MLYCSGRKIDAQQPGLLPPTETPDDLDAVYRIAIHIIQVYTTSDPNSQYIFGGSDHILVTFKIHE